MIRIDEIYNNTIWPWFNEQRSGTRVFFCDPFGYTDCDHLFNLGSDDIIETDYVYLHDQEPVHLDLHKPLFNDVIKRNKDITDGVPDVHGHVVVSEIGEYVEQLEKTYGWKSHYYFYHGWACMDWFRGYDKTFLIPRAKDRSPGKVFMSPNRIVAGKRDHRVLFLYNMFSRGLGDSGWLSAPRICPEENVDIEVVAPMQKHSAGFDISKLMGGMQAAESNYFLGSGTINEKKQLIANGTTRKLIVESIKKSGNNIKVKTKSGKIYEYTPHYGTEIEMLRCQEYNIHIKK
jgi:hypothetical protein